MNGMIFVFFVTFQEKGNGGESGSERGFSEVEKRDFTAVTNWGERVRINTESKWGGDLAYSGLHMYRKQIGSLGF